MSLTQAIPRELEDRVKRELESGEQIVWMGQPIPRFFTAVSTGAFLFAIPWTAFAIFWICGAAGFKVPDFSEGGFSFFPLFGIPFVLIGLGLLSSPLWTHRKAAKTVYAITDRRAITFDAGWTTTIRSYRPHQLQRIHRKERRDGTGDVILDQQVIAGARGEQRPMDLGFLNIRDPKTIEQILRKLAEQAR